MAKGRTRATGGGRHLGAVVRWVFSTFAIGAALVGALFAHHRTEHLLINDRRFALRPAARYGGASPDIRLEGIARASRDRILEVFAPDAGRSLYLVPAEERRRQLLTIDWVRNASVSRLWPNQVAVRIEERKPVAFVQLEAGVTGAMYRLVLIDKDGVLLGQPDGEILDLPVLTGIREDHTPAMRALRVSRMEDFLAEVPDLAPRISELNVEDPNNIKVRMSVNGDVLLLLLGRGNLAPRLRRFMQHYPEVHRRYPRATGFDLQLDDRITVLNGVSE